MKRWLTFNAVGLLGIGAQLLALQLFVFLLGASNYLWATAAAVELAIIHNFCWHTRWTWRDRPAGASERLARFLRFNLANGLNSLLGNLLLMRLFVGVWRWPLLWADLGAALVCGLINFALSETYVFRPQTGE
jgi:putative flippase GtrA